MMSCETKHELTEAKTLCRAAELVMKLSGLYVMLPWLAVVNQATLWSFSLSSAGGHASWGSEGR